MVEDRHSGSRRALVGARSQGTRRSVYAVASLLAAIALFSGCTKTSSVSAGASPTNAAPVAAPVAKRTCAEHMAVADPARQTEVGDEVAALGLPSIAPDLNTKVDAACQANPDSSFASVVRGLACSKATSTPAAAPTSAPGSARIDPRPAGLAVGHPARAGGGRGGGRSGSGSSSGSKSSGSSSGSSSSDSNSGSNSSGGSRSSNGSTGGAGSGSSGPVSACG